MLIGTEWKVESDGLNVILFKKRITVARTTGAGCKFIKPENIGKENWDKIVFYPDIKTALWGLSKHGILDTELTDMKTIDAKLDELKALIMGMPESIMSAKPTKGHTE